MIKQPAKVSVILRDSKFRRNNTVIFVATENPKPLHEDGLSTNELVPIKTRVSGCKLKEEDPITVYREDLTTLGIVGQACISNCKLSPFKEGPCKACYKEG